MKMEELKTGLFGYRKDGVYRLVASMEESFSSKLMEKDAQSARAMEEAKAKIASLEAELETLRQERQARQDQQGLIARAMLEAQAYARKLEEETREQEEQVRSRLQEQARQQAEVLERYGEQLGQLRASFQSLLRSMDGEAGELEQQTAALAAAAPPAPEPNLSLFRKRTGTED